MLENYLPAHYFTDSALKSAAPPGFVKMIKPGTKKGRKWKKNP